MQEEPSNNTTTVIALYAVFIKIRGYWIWQPFRKMAVQFVTFPPSRILKPYVYITQIYSQTFLSTKCLRACRADPWLITTWCHTCLGRNEVKRSSASQVGRRPSIWMGTVIALHWYMPFVMQSKRHVLPCCWQCYIFNTSPIGVASHSITKSSLHLRLNRCSHLQMHFL